MLKLRPLAIVASLVLACPPVFAQPPPSKAQIQIARSLFYEAMADQKAQRWEDALKKLERAGSIKLTSGILTHIALCKERLGRLQESVKDYEKALELGRTEKNKEVVDTVPDLLASVRGRIPTIRVTVPEREGIRVEVETATLEEHAASPRTAALSRTPEADYRLQVDPGEYVVVVHAPGMKEFRKRLRVPEVQIVTVDTTLEPEPLPTPVVKPIARTPEPVVEREGFWTARNTLTVGLLGAGVAALAGGAAFALASNGDKDDVDRLRGELPQSATGSQCYRPSAQQVVDTCGKLQDAMNSQNSKASLSTGFYVAGGAMVATGVAVWLLWPKPKSENRVGHVMPTVDFIGRSLGVQGTF